MDIGKLYETLTGEPCPHAPKAVVEAAWGLASEGGERRTAAKTEGGVRALFRSKPPVRPQA